MSFSNEESSWTQSISSFFYPTVRRHEGDKDANKFFHNPLIGIETNPGPVTILSTKKGKSRVKVSGRIVQLQPAKQSQGKKKQKQKSRKRPNGVSQIGPISTAYICQLTDPLRCPNMRSGFMTWTETILIEPYIRLTQLLSGTSQDGVVILVNPDASLSAGGAATAQLNNFCTLTTWNGSTQIGSATSLVAANRTNAITTVQTNRVNACGMEVVVSQPTTSNSGIITVSRLNGITSLSALDNQSPAFYQGLPQTRIYTTSGGNATVQVNWIPSDATDFEFAINAVNNNGEGVINPLIITLSGFPNLTTRYFLDLISHLEGQQGLLAAGADVVNEQAGNAFLAPTLVDEHASIDVLMKQTRPIISHASSAMEYATTKVHQVADIVNTSKDIVSNLKEMLTPSWLGGGNRSSQIKSGFKSLASEMKSL